MTSHFSGPLRHVTTGGFPAVSLLTSPKVWLSTSASAFSGEILPLGLSLSEQKKLQDRQDEPRNEPQGFAMSLLCLCYVSLIRSSALLCRTATHHPNNSVRQHLCPRTVVLDTRSTLSLSSSLQASDMHPSHTGTPTGTHSYALQAFLCILVSENILGG